MNQTSEQPLLAAKRYIEIVLAMINSKTMKRYFEHTFVTIVCTLDRNGESSVPLTSATMRILDNYPIF